MQMFIKPKSPPKTERLNLRVTAETYERIQALALAHNAKVHSVVEGLLLAALDAQEKSLERRANGVQGKDDVSHVHPSIKRN